MSGVQVRDLSYIIKKGDMSADIDSTRQRGYQVQDYTVQIWWVNGLSPVGEVQLWARVNPENDGDAIDKQMTLSSTLSVSGASGNLTLNLTKPLNNWYIKYNRTSGSGDLYVTVEGKSRG